MKNLILTFLFLFFLAPFAQAQQVNDSIHKFEDSEHILPQILNLKEVRDKIKSTYHPSKKNPLAGTLKFRILIDEKGNYSRHIVTYGGLNRKACEHAEKYLSELRFTPAYQRNKPIKFWADVPFNFDL
jgi:hypothetical protein